MSKIKIYTDGSCYNRTGQGGWAYIVTEDDKELHRDFGGDIGTTSNRMELQAIINALVFCKTEVPFEDIEIYSDSRYCVNGYNKWMYKWEKAGWQYIANSDLWEEMFENKGFDVTWVKGHSENKWNDEVDELANYKNYIVK